MRELNRRHTAREEQQSPSIESSASHHLDCTTPRCRESPLQSPPFQPSTRSHEFDDQPIEYVALTWTPATERKDSVATQSEHAVRQAHNTLTMTTHGNVSLRFSVTLFPAVKARSGRYMRLPFFISSSDPSEGERVADHTSPAVPPRTSTMFPSQSRSEYSRPAPSPRDRHRHRIWGE
jgi:hypothetical protein